MVDDDEDDRFLLKDAFESVDKNIVIVEICDGMELIELLNSQNLELEPALILMDMNMPRMSGLEALSTIKTDPGLSHIPVIMVSTSSNEDMIKLAYQHGVDSYHTKPVTHIEYTKIVQIIVEKLLR